MAGSEDDTSSDSLNGADLALELGNAIVNIRHQSETAGDADPSATTAATEYSFGDVIAIYENVTMGDSQYKLNHYELQYGFSDQKYPLTMGVGQSTATYPSRTDNRIHRIYAGNLEVREGLALTLDFLDLDSDGTADDSETTTVKVSYQF